METDRFLAEKLIHPTFPDMCGDEFKNKFSPLTDIAQCFEYVVPKMRELGYEFTMSIDLGGKCYAQFATKDFINGKYNYKFGSELPAAICEAARAALEGE